MRETYLSVVFALLKAFLDHESLHELLELWPLHQPLTMVI
jgi:hypothetical protein